MLKNIKFDTKKMAQSLNCSEVAARILINRGIADREAAHRFLSASIEQLYEPTLMKDIEKAAIIMKNAVKSKSKILVVGDYDVDGVISTYILYKALYKCGANVNYHIPDRISEGYGINENIIRNASVNSVDVIITCDNGIAAIEQVKLAKELGMTIIVTDHHDIQFIEKEDGSRDYIVPSADAVINPKQLDCGYPFKFLCGAGVAFKFVQVLYRFMNMSAEEAYEFLEYAAIATVCDVVDLVEENRIIVKKGLELINKTNNIGLKALFNETGIDKKGVSIYAIGFVIGPSINASGRLEQAIWALKLLLSENENEARELAKRLHELNQERQEITTIGVETAVGLIETSEIIKDKVKVVYMPEVHESVAGIIAGRLREKYNVPAFVITKGKEGVKGSGRSIEEYNMFEELLKCKDILGKFGGHPMAAGLSLEEENIELFREKINKNCSLSDEDIIPKIIIDMHLPLSAANMELAKELQSLEPFGKGNSKPMFAEKKIRIFRAQVLGQNRNVLKLKLIAGNGKLIDAIYFGDIDAFNEEISQAFGESELQKMYYGNPNEITIDLVYSVSINEYMGKVSLQLVIASFRV